MFLSPAVKGIDRVQHITALGVASFHNFSINTLILSWQAVRVLFTVFEPYGLMVCLRPVCS